jgi:hypothetical protein
MCYGIVGVMLNSQCISTVKAMECSGWIGLVMLCRPLRFQDVVTDDVILVWV